jgi:hypothetical protein
MATHSRRVFREPMTGPCVSGSIIPSIEIPMFSITDNTLHTEMKIPHAETTGCPFCSKDFNSKYFQSKSSYERHMINVHKFSKILHKFSCRHCGFCETKSKYPLKDINRHITESHISPENKNDSFPCHLCDRVFPSALSRGNHTRSHSVSAVNQAKNLLRKLTDENKQTADIRKPIKYARQIEQTSSLQSIPEEEYNTDIDVLKNLLAVDFNINLSEIEDTSAWLSDDTIHSYFTLLCSRQVNWSCLHPQIISIFNENTNLFRKFKEICCLSQKLLVPFLQDGGHWVLFTINFLDESITFLDPMHRPCRPSNINTIINLANTLSSNDTHKVDYTITSPDYHLLQTDTSSCGAYICYYARSIILDGSTGSYNNIAPAGVRQSMLQDLTDPTRLTCSAKPKYIIVDLDETNDISFTEATSTVIHSDPPALESHNVDLSLTDDPPNEHVTTSWRSSIFSDAKLSETEIHFSNKLKGIGPSSPWEDFIDIVNEISQSVKRNKKSSHKSIHQKNKRDPQTNRHNTPSQLKQAQYHSQEQSTASRNKEASKIQRKYKMSKKAAARQILSNHSPMCEIPVDRVESYFSHELTAPGDERGDSFDDIAKKFLTHRKVENAFYRPFTPAEVIGTLRSMKDSAPGEDGIRYSELTKFDPNGRILAFVYNHCKDTKRIPASWKSSLVTLIHKKGDTNSIENWRPISLCRTIYKLYTKLWSSRLMKELSTRLSSEQKGFMPNEGCLEHIFTLDSILNDAKKKKKNLCIAWLDLCNAFGSIPHELIKSNLLQMGFPDSFIDLVMDLYTDSNCRVKVGNKTTKVIQVGRGVKQGDPLSPLLFNIAIEPVLRLAKNEFSESAYECFDSRHNILAYADDLGLITNDIEAMRKLLTKIETLMGNMQIKLNASKCATLSLIKGKINISNSLSLKNEKIQALDIGNYYEYLGKQIGIGNDRSPTQMLKSFISDIYKINRSLLSDWQKLDAIKTFVISRLGFILRNGDVPRSVLKQVDRALIDVSRKIANFQNHHLFTS